MSSITLQVKPTYSNADRRTCDGTVALRVVSLCPVRHMVNIVLTTSATDADLRSDHIDVSTCRATETLGIETSDVLTAHRQSSYILLLKDSKRDSPSSRSINTTSR